MKTEKDKDFLDEDYFDWKLAHINAKQMIRINEDKNLYKTVSQGLSEIAEEFPAICEDCISDFFNYHLHTSLREMVPIIPTQGVLDYHSDLLDNNKKGDEKTRQTIIYKQSIFQAINHLMNTCEILSKPNLLEDHNEQYIH